MEPKVDRARLKSNSIIGAAPFSLEAAEKWVLEKTEGLPPEPSRLTSYWHIDFVRQPAPQERKTRYTMRMAQSENYGLAFALHGNPSKPDADFVGKDARQILKKRLWRDFIDRTALVDLVMGNLSQTAGEKVT